MIAAKEYSRARTLIDHSGAEPEKRLVAVLLADARLGCLEGEESDCQWLRSCAAAYLELIRPDSVNPEALMNRLLDGLPEPVRETDIRWQAETDRFVQLMLLKLED